MMSALYSIAEAVPDTASDQYVLKLRDLPREEKPREKLLRYGPDVLEAHELLAIILGTGTKKEEVLAMTRRILKEYGEKTIAHERNVTRLMEDLDVPKAKACQIVACFEIGRRFFAQSNSRSITVRTPQQVYEYLHDMARLPKEHLRGLYLNSRYQLIHDEVISIGSATANIVHPREVFRPAIEFSASAVILAHNHPSGEVTPSDADITITKQLQEAGALVGIELLDHIVVTEDGFSSILQAIKQT